VRLAYVTVAKAITTEVIAKAKSANEVELVTAWIDAVVARPITDICSS
jgi:hypothetical protein